MKRAFARATALGAAVLLVSSSSPAQITVCGINSVSAVAFGTYNPNAMTPLDALGSVTYQCSVLGALALIFLELGTGSSNTYTTRQLVSGTHTIDYNLYLDQGRLFVFGDGSAGTVRFGPTILTLFPVTVTVYGRIPPGQNAFVGSYTDTIVVTAQF